MACYGQSFYRQYLRVLKTDPVRALHMLRAAKEKAHADIERAMRHMKPMIAEPTSFSLN